METIRRTILMMIVMLLGYTAHTMAWNAPKVQETQQSASTVTVTGNGVRLRFGPGLDYGYLTYKSGAARCPKKGEKLTLLGEDGDWYKVMYAGQQLYIFKSYAKPGGAVSTPSYMVQITGTSVHLRFGPGMEYGYLTWDNGKSRCPKNGERLTYLGAEGDWYKVMYGGSEYYVSKKYAKLVK